jgi:translation elongation factor EF-Tu-like GTPase
MAEYGAMKCRNTAAQKHKSREMNHAPALDLYQTMPRKATAQPLFDVVDTLFSMSRRGCNVLTVMHDMLHALQ